MKNQRLINLNSWIRQHAEGRNLERTEVAKTPPQHTRKEVDESRKRGGGEAASATRKERIATIQESEEEAKPPPQRTRKEGNDSRKRGGGEATSATHEEGGQRFKKARRRRSHLRNARGRRATIQESEEAAQPPPQRKKRGRPDQDYS
jgi:hypothetical protein